MIKGLQLDNRYAGIFLTKTTDIANRIQNILGDSDVSVWLYESPEMVLCIIIGDEHTESVINWFQKAHEIADGSSMLSGILSNRRLQPRKSDNYFFRIHIDEVHLESFIRHIEKNKLFCMFIPHSNELCVLTDGNNGLQLRNYFNNVMPMTGFVLRSIIKKSKKNNKKIIKHYDPIGAQVGEMLSRFPVALNKLIQDTAISWKNILHTEPPLEIKEICGLINSKIIEFKNCIKDFHEADKDSNLKKALLRHIDNTIYYFKIISHSYANFKDSLREYNLPINPWNNSTNYLELSTPLVLNAAKKYLDELKDRAGISTEIDIIPIFSDDYAAYPLLPPGLIPTGNRTRIISMPREAKLRLGAFPILGHEVGHFILEKKSDFLVAEIISDLVNEKCAISFHGAFSDLDKIWRDGKLQKVTSINEMENMIEQMKLFKNRISVILCDLIATALVGPAYVYALPRFALGTMGYFSDRNRHQKTHPSIASRILLCIELLVSLGFTPSFNSEYLEVSGSQMDRCLVDKIISLIKEPYSCYQHSNIEEIQNSLAKGIIISNRPTLIINALWDAVIHRKNYINEIATLSSLVAN